MRRASRYLHLARKSIDMAEQASHPNNRDTILRFAATWVSLAADELAEASRDHSDAEVHLADGRPRARVQR
jgi:hypothetical protein